MKHHRLYVASDAYLKIKTKKDWIVPSLFYKSRMHCKTFVEYLTVFSLVWIFVNVTFVWKIFQDISCLSKWFHTTLIGRHLVFFHNRKDLYIHVVKDGGKDCTWSHLLSILMHCPSSQVNSSSPQPAGQLQRFVVRLTLIANIVEDFPFVFAKEVGHVGGSRHSGC